MGTKIPMYSLEEHKKKLITDLQDFLLYKRTNTLDFGARLLKQFSVVGFASGPSEDNIMVQFEGYETMPHANHYWVSKKELDEFLNGKKENGASLMIDQVYKAGNSTIFEINLLKNGFKRPNLSDAQKLKGVSIKHEGNLFKCYDVEVLLDSEENSINKIIKAHVFESCSAEEYVNKHTVRQNKVEIKNGITFEDFDTQEEFVRKFEALEAVRLGRKDVVNEIRSWLTFNMTDKIEGPAMNAILKKLQEIS